MAPAPRPRCWRVPPEEERGAAVWLCLAVCTVCSTMYSLESGPALAKGSLRLGPPWRRQRSPSAPSSQEKGGNQMDAYPRENPRLPRIKSGQAAFRGAHIEASTGSFYSSFRPHVLVGHARPSTPFYHGSTKRRRRRRRNIVVRTCFPRARGQQVRPPLPPRCFFTCTADMARLGSSWSCRAACSSSA